MEENPAPQRAKAPRKRDKTSVVKAALVAYLKARVKLPNDPDGRGPRQKKHLENHAASLRMVISYVSKLPRDDPRLQRLVGLTRVRWDEFAQSKRENRIHRAVVRCGLACRPIRQSSCRQWYRTLAGRIVMEWYSSRGHFADAPVAPATPVIQTQAPPAKSNPNPDPIAAFDPVI